MKKYEKEKNNPGCFIRKDGNNTFLEVLSPTPEFNKVTVNFVEYDKTTFKQIRLIPIYFTVPEFLVLCKKIEQGIIARKAFDEKQRCLTNNVSFPNSIYQQLGGTPASSPANKRADRRDEARVFSILPATKSKFADVMFQAERGPGNTTKEGLISMDRSDRNAIEKVIVSLSFDNMLEIALISQMRIQAYITDQQIKGHYTYIGNNENSVSPNPVPTSDQRPEPKNQPLPQSQNIAYDEPEYHWGEGLVERPSNNQTFNNGQIIDRFAE